MTLRWADVFVLYRWELRSALRDRTIVVNSLVIPVILYPALLWLILTGIAFVRGQTDDLASRVAFIGHPSDHDALRQRFSKDDRLQMIDTPNDGHQTEELLRSGTLDAVVTVRSVPGDLPGNVHVDLLFDASRERSALARQRVEAIVASHRDAWLRDEASALGTLQAPWTGFALVHRNVASGRDVGSFLLGLLLPLFFVVMVALGCLTPAIDVTAGERERQTWETLMTTAASRGSIVTAKYLVVTTLGGIAGLLNVIAMTLALRGVLAPMLEPGSTSEVVFRVSPGAVPILVAGAVFLAAMLAAGMMLLAAFARSFREGQSMVSPFFLAAVLPAMFLAAPGVTLSQPLAFVPVVNIALVVREAIGGAFKPWESLVALLSTLLTIGLLLRLAVWVLAMEHVVVGSPSGSLARVLRERLPRRKATPSSSR